MKKRNENENKSKNKKDENRSNVSQKRYVQRIQFLWIKN